MPRAISWATASSMTSCQQIIIKYKHAILCYPLPSCPACGYLLLQLVEIVILMNENQEAREGLLVYLEANRSYIEEKVYNEFNVECIENKTLKTLDVAKMKKTIQDIFDFSDNEIYAYFFAHLEANIREYIKQQYSNKAVASFYVLDIEKLTDIVKFCIAHGFDANAKRAVKEKPVEKPAEKPMQKVVEKVQKVKEVIKERPKVVFIKEQRKVQPPKDQFAHIKPRISTFLQRDKIPEKKEFKIQKFVMPEINVLPRYLISIPKPVVKQEEEEATIVVAPLDDSYLNAHRKAMRDRLEKLFNFYCYQQQSLGQGPTFDRMKEQGQVMNLGKFMQFCQYTKLFHCKEITRDALMTEYKRSSEGKADISFDIFERIIQRLDEKYLQSMGHDAVNNPIPTYEARLQLNEPNKLGELKKHRHLIFGTRSKEGREVKEYSQNDRYVKKELTLHSGRFGSDLSIDFKEKNEQKSSKSAHKPKPVRVSDTTIHLNELKKLKLPKISWIVDEQQQVAVAAKPNKK